MRTSYFEKKYFRKKKTKSLQRAKKLLQFFNGLNPSFVTNNKRFWKTVKPFFSDTGDYGANIKLVKEEILQNDSEIAEELNEFFKNAVSPLGITENSFIINEECKNISDPV